MISEALARCGRGLARLAAVLCLLCTPASAATLNFAVNTSRPVTVTGTPRIAIDVGGVTRYASYVAGSGTRDLTFAYVVQPGDFDANGISLVSPLELNGGSIVDAVGNPATNLAFTVPDTANLKVQTYTAAFTTSPITSANANAVSFLIAKAPAGASFDYTITSDGGSGSVTGAGTVSGLSHTVSGVDLSALAPGTLRLSVTVSTTAGGTGAARTASATPTLIASPLDGLSAAAAYSTRRLRSDYTGPLIRVRRASDDAEQDIAATLWGALNTAALTSFCNGSSCFVRTWYDQSGNGRDASQATASLQPRAVNGGALEAENGQLAPYFTGGAGVSLKSANAKLDFTSNTLVAVCRNIGTVSGLGGVVSSGIGGWGIFYNLNSGYLLDGAGVGPTTTAKTGITSNFVQLSGMYETASTTNSSIYMNGGLVEKFTGTGVSLNNGLSPIEVGGRTVSGLTTRTFTGRISEVIVFTGALSSASRQALERNQGAWFAIPVM